MKTIPYQDLQSLIKYSFIYSFLSNLIIADSLLKIGRLPKSVLCAMFSWNFSNTRLEKN